MADAAAAGAEFKTRCNLKLTDESERASEFLRIIIINWLESSKFGGSKMATKMEKHYEKPNRYARGAKYDLKMI